MKKSNRLKWQTQSTIQTLIWMSRHQPLAPNKRHLMKAIMRQLKPNRKPRKRRSAGPSRKMRRTRRQRVPRWPPTSPQERMGSPQSSLPLQIACLPLVLGAAKVETNQSLRMTKTWISISATARHPTSNKPRKNASSSSKSNGREKNRRQLCRVCRMICKSRRP